MKGAITTTLTAAAEVIQFLVDRRGASRNSEPMKELLLAEQESIRNELLHLKNCQVRYFLLSITATGALLGLAGNIGEQVTPPDAIFLSPLAVILPCWWIFFDKATSITRNVGYLRVLEDRLLEAVRGERLTYQHRGWENSLEKFRGEQKKRQEESWLKRTSGAIGTAVTKGTRALFLAGSHSYWALSWWTFLLLSCASLQFGTGLFDRGLGFLLRSWWGAPLFAAVFLSALHNLFLVGDLTSGSRSYSRNERFWRESAS